MSECCYEYLEEIKSKCEKMREDGDTDLRGIINFIEKLQNAY